MIAVQFDQVSKAYDLHAGEGTILKSIRTISGLQKKDDLFYALSDVSFTIKKGEAFGIIGRNGAGKSTILKIISGITKPTSGGVTVNGLVSSLIELGAGFHPDLTGRENVYLSAAILGIPKKAIDRKFAEIVDFAELWDFIDVPVKKYSSGMYARLGFSVAISVEPEILIIDEILSVGDVFFQQKCFKKMKEVISRGTTFLYVTHDTVALQNLCDQAILLDVGRIEYIGSAVEAVSRYYSMAGTLLDGQKFAKRQSASGGGKQAVDTQIVEGIREHSILGSSVRRHGARGLEVVAARVTNPEGMDTLKVPLMGNLKFTMLIQAHEDVEDPSCGFHLYNRMGVLVFAAGTRQKRYPLPSLRRGDELVVSLEVGFSVEPGEYTFSLGTAEPSADGQPNVGFIHDRHEMLGPIEVIADVLSVFPFYGVADLPMNVSHLSHTRSETAVR